MRLKEVAVDAALLLVAVGCLLSAAALVLPDARPVPAPAVASPPERDGVLVVRAAGTPGAHLSEAGRRLGWPLGEAPLPLPKVARERDFEAAEGVLVQAADGPAEDAAAAVDRVRALQPRLRIVLVGPLGLVPGEKAAARDLLRETATATGADFVDPVGSRWLTGPGLLRDGEVTAAGVQVLGQRLAEAVRRADQVRAQQAGD